MLVSTAASKKGIYTVFVAWFWYWDGRATGLASVIRYYKLSLCPMDPIPAGTKMDLLLAKAEPITDGGNTSGIKELRRGKSCSVQQQLRPVRGVRRCERNSSVDIRVHAQGGAGGAPATGAEIPLQPQVEHMVRQLFPHSPWRSMVEQTSTCSPWRTQGGGAGGCVQRRLWP